MRLTITVVLFAFGALPPRRVQRLPHVHTKVTAPAWGSGWGSGWGGGRGGGWGSGLKQLPGAAAGAPLAGVAAWCGGHGAAGMVRRAWCGGWSSTDH